MKSGNLYDEDGIDGPFDRAMAVSMRNDARRSAHAISKRIRDMIEIYARGEALPAKGYNRSIDPLEYIHAATIDLVRAARRASPKGTL